MALITAALIAVGGSALNAKIAKNRANNPLDTVTARAAGMPGGGAPIGITPVEGTGAEGITPFEYGQESNGQPVTQEELMAILQQMSPEQAGGIVSAATGKYLNRANGGGTNFDWLNFLTEKGFDPSMPNQESKYDSIEAMIAANKPPIDEIVASSSNAIPIPEPDINIPSPEMPEQRGGIMGLADNVGAFAETNPEVFNAIVSTLGNLISTAINKPKDAPAQLDSRPLHIAGNANRRAIQFNPVGAKNGGTLNRPMFMPHGGAMRGPGGPKEDLIPVMASNGEYMLSKAAVDQAGGGNHRLGIAKLNAFNNRGNRRYG